MMIWYLFVVHLCCAQIICFCIIWNGMCVYGLFCQLSLSIRRRQNEMSASNSRAMNRLEKETQNSTTPVPTNKQANKQRNSYEYHLWSIYCDYLIEQQHFVNAVSMLLSHCTDRRPAWFRFTNWKEESFIEYCELRLLCCVLDSQKYIIEMCVCALFVSKLLSRCSCCCCCCAFGTCTFCFH